MGQRHASFHNDDSSSISDSRISTGDDNFIDEENNCNYGIGILGTGKLIPCD